MPAHRTWRLIQSGKCAAAFNMALDEAIAVAVRRGGLPPTLRFYGWERPSVSLGCFQKASDIDALHCAAGDIPVVRRPTGGRAILHGDELTYSFSVRTDAEPFSAGLLDSYRRIGGALGFAFAGIGVRAEPKDRRERGSVLSGSPLCFRASSYGEILVDRKKVVGSAQKRWEDGLLQQGSIPYSLPREELRRIFGGNAEDIDDCAAGLREIAPAFDEERFRAAVVSAFEEVFAIRLLPSLPTEEELRLARDLERRKYLQPEWTLCR